MAKALASKTASQPRKKVNKPVESNKGPILTSGGVRIVANSGSGNVLHASITKDQPGYGKTVVMTNRSTATVSTGVVVESLTGNHVVCFRLHESLSQKGVVCLNAPGRLASGEIVAHLLNSGREIVNIGHDTPLLHVWVETNLTFSWSHGEN